ncbi:DNA repair protein RecN [Corynebacterium freiburgense]|uniref:DNA repair protein RecN n=1 Tax=Corynebacterium freiburgense TaxID=556548 RepID=UPI00042244ED|nr:DNA repair protein RecN [Corynebacterium freiburgense]WJZ02543.1 DNA repair protein RecN [Corynebacterium freiburgense]
MLAEISIENLGVIPAVSAELHPGFTVLTGETGAGKTMVVSGLRLLGGTRADASKVRTGANHAVVEGRFLIEQLPDEAQQTVINIVESAGGMADEQGELIASRVVNASGRSKAHLGGRSVPAATLQEFSVELLTIHGQNDQLRLLAPDRQLAALDRSNSEIPGLLETYQKHYRKWRVLSKDLFERTSRRRELAQEIDRLQFAIDEINELQPVAGEDTDLIASIRRLQDVDTLREQATIALTAIDGDVEFSGDEISASDQLGRAQASLVSSEDSSLRELGERLAELTSALSDISAELGHFLSDLPTDAGELEFMLQRQQQLKQLTRKYAPDIDGVLQWRDKAQRKLESIDVSGEALEQLQAEVAASEKKMLAAAKKLSNTRKKAAKELSSLVTDELHGLAMPKTKFIAELRTIEPSNAGIDEVEFLLAAHSEAEPRPIAVSASGGELSRVMLALEVILSSGSTGTTLVFDEVDAGVGGRAAIEIGRRLARLSVHNQVIVVTHLPQVAAFADAHLHVAKNVGDASVTSGLAKLEGDERVNELARMLAGMDDTDSGRAHAAELLEMAESERKRFSV